MASTISSFSARRRVVSAADVVRVGTLAPQLSYPAVIEPGGAALEPSEWAAQSQGMIETLLAAEGAVLFRGFDIAGAAAFRSFVAALAPALLDYRERAAPRTEKAANIYSSTEYPPAYPIPMHHELAYAHQWPMRLWFHCETPAQDGGATPIARDDVFLASLDPRIRARFEQKGVMYVRNYGPVLDMPWQEAFQTSDRAEVEHYCSEAGLECRWRDGGRLRTVRTTPAMRVHPRTGRSLWFNHAHLFHISNVEPELRAHLMASLDPDDYPRNAFYGDGSAIEDDVLDEIRRAYTQASIRFAWKRGDVLLLDNMAMTHGREPFSGPRSILVAMTDPVFARDLQ